jgi:hypothetical protein
MLVTTLINWVGAATDSAAEVVGSLGVAAPDPTDAPTPGEINTRGVQTFIASKIAPILLAVLGVIFISRAGKGEMSKVLTSSAIAILGLAFIAGAFALFAFGESLVQLILPTE